MDEIQKIDVKVFAERGEDIDPFTFVPVLQRWIQEHSIPGVLIDVADYKHIHHGAGIILVGHEYNVSIDYAGGRMGLLVHMKRPSETSFADRVRAALKLAYACCKLLEEDPAFEGQLQFSRTDLRFMVSDRLHAPNDDSVFQAIHDAVDAVAEDVLGGKVALTRRGEDPRERLTIDLVAVDPVDLAAVGA
jgi:hypothetical protein